MKQLMLRIHCVPIFPRVATSTIGSLSKLPSPPKVLSVLS